MINLLHILIYFLGIPIIIILSIALIKWVWRTYNDLISKSISVDEIAGNLEAILQKKFNMIPLLIEIVNNYAKHENSTFTIVTQLRSQWGAAKTTKDKIKNANKLEAALAKLLVMQEQYPQLKANENFQSLQQNASEMETQILIERRNYNEIVKEYNIQVKLFPKNIVAKIFRFSERDFYSNKDIQGAVEPGLAMHGSEMRSTAEQGKGF